ncbi:hypothetical protein DJ68_08205, partial [Halorubrum sp. C3]
MKLSSPGDDSGGGSEGSDSADAGSGRVGPDEVMVEDPFGDGEVPLSDVIAVLGDLFEDPESMGFAPKERVRDLEDEDEHLRRELNDVVASIQNLCEVLDEARSLKWLNFQDESSDEAPDSEVPLPPEDESVTEADSEVPLPPEDESV